MSGLDLVDGTPVLDIKPYVTPYDSLPEARCPEWVMHSAWQSGPSARTVSFRADVEAIIDDAARTGKLKFYSTGAQVEEVVTQLIVQDVRPVSSYRKRKQRPDCPEDLVCYFRFDMLFLGYTVDDENRVEIVHAKVEDGSEDSSCLGRAILQRKRKYYDVVFYLF